MKRNPGSAYQDRFFAIGDKYNSRIAEISKQISLAYERAAKLRPDEVHGPYPLPTGPGRSARGVVTERRAHDAKRRANLAAAAARVDAATSALHAERQRLEHARDAEYAALAATRTNPGVAHRRGAAAKRKRNPLSPSYEAGLAKSRQIGIDNAEMAIDQRRTYPSVRAAYAAYIVNAIDTVTEYKLPSREVAVQAFLDHVAKPRKRRK